EAEPTEHTGPISAADILARMGHKFDDDPNSDSAFEPESPAPSMQTGSLEDAPNAAWGNTAKEAEGGDDDSIDEYMARLLQRVRGDDEPAEDSTRRAPATAGGSSQPSVERSSVEEEPVEEEKAPLTADEFKPARQAPEANTNLSAMRELANTSARTAITASNRKKGMRITLTFMALTVISGSGGLGLILCSFLMQSLILAGVALGFLAFGGFTGWKTLGLWKTYFVVHKGIEKSKPAPRSASHDDGLTPLYQND
ncbi:MAG: hypothetical protein ACI9G1_005624, partial [Pirellulaceae bacterium]